VSARLLAVEAAPGELRVAWGERRFGTVRITSVERLPLEHGAESLPITLAALAAARPAVVLTTLPLARTTHRMLTLPFRDRTRVAGTAPLELFGQLPISADDATVAARVLGPAPGGSEVLAVAVPRAALDAQAACFATAGLPATRIDLAPLAALQLLADDDAALVLADGRASALVVRRGGRLAALRALGADAADAVALAAEVRWTLRALGDGTRIVVAGPDAPATQAALAPTVDDPVELLVPPPALAGAGSTDDVRACAVAVGLLAGEGRGDGARVVLAGGGEDAGRWRRAAVLAAAAALLGVVDVALVRTTLVRRAAAVERAAIEVTAAALPGTALPVARGQLEEAVAARRRLRPAGDVPVLEVLRELSTRVPGTLRLDLDELVVEADVIRLHGRAQSFDAVEALRAALAGSPLVREVAIDDTHTTVDGTGVEFRVRATRRTALGAPS
jgi:hypothetical protein